MRKVTCCKCEAVLPLRAVLAVLPLVAVVVVVCSHRRRRWWFHRHRSKWWRIGSCPAVFRPSGRCRRRRWWSERGGDTSRDSRRLTHSVWLRGFCWRSPPTCRTSGCRSRWWTGSPPATAPSRPVAAAGGSWVARPRWRPAPPASHSSPPDTRLDPTRSAELWGERKGHNGVDRRQQDVSEIRGMLPLEWWHRLLQW